MLTVESSITQRILPTFGSRMQRGLRKRQDAHNSLEFAFNKILFKIFGTLSKDTYTDICSYFGLCSIEDMISTRQSRFTLNLCV